jgi:tRNA A-37 threonylcarbamoyl transferase component Bud32
MRIDHGDPKLLAAAEALVQGSSVDWQRLRSECDSEMVDGLQAIEKLLNQSPVAGPRWPAIGASWLHLVIKEQLGTGGDSIVYRAFDAMLDRDVALKLRYPHSKAVADRLAEGQRLACVDHPNVLKIHGAADHDGLLGLWCDLIKGESLAKWAEEGRRLGSAELITLGSELCAALASIHAAGLIHGDIKPANVIRDTTGRFVLVDFGASVRIGDADKICGTPLYVAPELLEGAMPSVSSDIYGLGALLFRLSSGVAPVTADTFEELLVRQREQGAAQLFDLRPDLPPVLIRTVQKSLAANAAQRYRSAGEFAAALAACLPAARPQVWARSGFTAMVLSLLTLVMWQVFSPAPAKTDALKFVRTGGTLETALNDGSTIQPGDTFALDVTPARSSFVYVINEDAHGENYQLFPLKGAALTNPLPALRKQRLPGLVDGSMLDWQVTTRGGVEHFYVLVSSHAIPELESGKKLALTSRSAAVEYQDALATGPTRGVGGLERHAPSAQAPSSLEAWIRQLMASDADLRVERVALNNP